MQGDSVENAAHIRDKCDNGNYSKSGELSSSSDSEGSGAVYQGFVFHVGVNSLGHQFCHPRYLRIRGKYVEMFKKDPNVYPDAKPIRQGIAGQFLIVEDLGRRKIGDKELYVLKIYSCLDDSRSGEIACLRDVDVQNWKAAFQQAKEEAELDFPKGSGHRLVDDTDEFKLNGRRHRVRRYVRGLTKLITIGIGPESLLRRETKGMQESGSDAYAQKQEDDIVDEHEWRCVCTVNGIRILEDVAAYKAEKIVIMKSVGVIEASPSSIFEMLTDLKNPHRKEWDVLIGDLELIERINGHCDVVYGTFDPKYLRRWNSKRDFIFTRIWRHDPDNTYSIIQLSKTKTLKDCPKKSGFRRIMLNPSSWEIKPLPVNGAGFSRSLVTQTMEIRSTGWGRWRKKYYAKFDRTMPYVVLCQIAGLRDYFAANPEPGSEVSTTTFPKEMKKALGGPLEVPEVSDAQEEFYDAIAADGPAEDEEDSDEDDRKPKKQKSHKFRSITLGLMGLRPRSRKETGELVLGCPPVEINIADFKGSLPPAASIKDSNCWADPGGRGFVVRGKTYRKDYLKVPGGDPLLKLLAVDWFKSEKKINLVATHPKCVVQSQAGKQLPFILVINLQVPAKPNYSLVFYFGADRPIRKGSLLDRFANGDDTFRDSRFKLIPSIVEGYWVVKRAVGTKACLLGKAVTCNYHRQSNFLEIDVDIGSSSVARSVISLVLGYVTSIVVDMAILIEGREEEDLPEYLSGTTRINRIRLESAVPYWTE